MDSKKERILDLMREDGLVKVLEKDKNTGEDSVFIDFVKASGYPIYHYILANMVAQEIPNKKYKQLIGVYSESWPWVSSIGGRCNLNSAIIQKNTPRLYFDSDVMGNKITKNNFLLISLYNDIDLKCAFDDLRELKYKPKDIFVFLDDEINKFNKGIKIKSLFKEKEVLGYLKQK